MRRMKRLLAILFTLASLSAAAATPLPQTFSCGKEGSAGGLGGGTDLTRYTLDLARYPEAVCNDTSPGVFYYGAATTAADRNKWIILLQGGGSCYDGQSCAERWCSIDTNYGADKMSSALTKAQIRGAGFMNPGAHNQFGTWNRVLIFYCSSDAWSGSAVRTLKATLNAQGEREYEIPFRGRRIIDAVVDTLRYAGKSRRRAVGHGLQSEATVPGAWPDLDEAEAVMFAGSSAGGAGVRANLDRVGEKLRLTNPDVDYRGLIDAIYGSLSETRDFTKSTYCAADPRGCDYETYMKSARLEVEQNLFAAIDDASCLAWHTANAPGTEWRCSDGEHVNLHHLSTPFFIHQDIQDKSIGGGFVEANFGTAADYATRVESELRNLPVPEEPRGATPGLFLPQCTDHESFTDNAAVFEVRIQGASYHDAVWNWWRNAQPQQLIRHFSGTPGKAPGCP